MRKKLRLRPKLAPTIPGIFIQAVARAPTLDAEPRAYPYTVPAIRHLTELRFETTVTFFVGENGSGKSTLLEGLAVAFGLNPEGGTKHERFTTQATHSDLFRSLLLTKSRDAPTDSYFLRAESFYNLASSVDPRDFDRYGGRSLHAQSHGESFLALVLHRLRGNADLALEALGRALEREAASRRPYHCRACGRHASEWAARCPDCGAWDTLRPVADFAA